MAVLAENRYGKHKVRVVKVIRQDGVHDLFEWEVGVLIEGNYEDCFLHGSNGDILPTDTMKNTIYSLARASKTSCIENFAKELVEYFLSTYAQALVVSVEIKEKLWRHLEIEGRIHASTFEQHADEVQITWGGSATLFGQAAGGCDISRDYRHLA